MVLLAGPGPIFAFHGLFPTTYGARPAGMGGASTAVGGSPLDLALNPAHLAREGNLFEAGLALNFARLDYEDRFLDPATGAHYQSHRQSHPIAPFPALGLSLGSGSYGWGLALYLVGGGGGQYDDLLRSPTADQNLAAQPGPLRENVDFRFMLLKLSPGFAFALTKNLRLGLTIDAAFARMFLDRETRDASGLRVLSGGIHYRSDPVLAPGFKLGALWQATPALRFGYAYESALSLHFDGELRVDSASVVSPEYARVSRSMRWPDRHGAGLSLELDRWIFAVDLRYIGWSQFFRSTRFVLEESRLSLPTGSPSNQFAMRFGWRDQWIIGSGLEYNADVIVLRGGYSYGRTPIAGAGASPFLGATTEHHLSAGAGVAIGSGLLNVAVERAFEKRVKGEAFSDWWLSRALVFEPETIRPAGFLFSRSTSVWTVTAGWQTPI